MRRDRPPKYRQYRGGPSRDGAPWPRTELLARLDAWAVGRASECSAWQDGTATPDDLIGAAVLALPLLWRAAVVQRHLVGQTVRESARTIGLSAYRLNEHYLRALSVVHGYLLATDPPYREFAHAHDLAYTVDAYRPARAGPVDPAAE